LGIHPHGVRVLVLSDSCHSGTVTRAAEIEALIGAGAMRLFNELNELHYKMMPPEVAAQVYREKREKYDPILREKNQGDKVKARASILLISGCQDNQRSLDGPKNSLFTAKLLDVWRGGAFDGDYRDFHGAIIAKMPPFQSPNYFWVGIPSLSFERQKPFTREKPIAD
jgi:metacaspase-1